MKHLIASMSLIVTLLAGCDEVKKGKEMHIFGGMAVQNKAKTMLDVSVVMDGRAIEFGVLVAGATAAMGFGQFELGKEMKIVWLEDYSKDNPIKSEAFFDSNKLSNIAGQIKEIEFVYLGEKKWKLRAYKEPHRNAKDLLAEIDSDESNPIPTPK